MQNSGRGCEGYKESRKRGIKRFKRGNKNEREKWHGGKENGMQQLFLSSYGDKERKRDRAGKMSVLRSNNDGECKKPKGGADGIGCSRRTGSTMVE